MQKAEEKGPSKDDTVRDKDRKRKREYVKVNLTHIQFECIFFSAYRICIFTKKENICIAEI